MFRILGNKINEVQGTTCGLGTPHALKFRSRGRSRHSLTSSGPISHHHPSLIFPLGNWLLLETKNLKQMASLGSALAIPPFRQALSSAPHLSSLKSLQRLPCLQPSEMLGKEYHLSHLPLCTPFLFLHFTCHHVTFYMILYLLILFLH